ncbi:NAD-dependent SIR2 family protein deacetylase [Pedobacter sp. AK017]|nr:NAD-dependent SIR2 family protein deacetylase [Pedobacter sp. AK017]
MDVNYFINEVITNLRKHTLAIYCGAGISYNSGLPIANQLLSCLYKTLQLDD